MTLKTTCEGGHVSGFTAEVEHDAAMAHALVLAMAWVAATYGDSDFAKTVIGLIEGAADRQMKNWGYTED